MIPLRPTKQIEIAPAGVNRQQMRLLSRMRRKPKHASSPPTSCGMSLSLARCGMPRANSHATLETKTYLIAFRNDGRRIIRLRYQAGFHSQAYITF